MFPHFYFFVEENAFKVLTNDRGNGESVQGIPILQKAYYTHKDNAEVVESICTLFMEMTEYGKCAGCLCLLFLPLLIALGFKNVQLTMMMNSPIT